MIKNSKTIKFSFGDKETSIELGNSIVHDQFLTFQEQFTEAIIIADKTVNDLWNNEVYLTLLKVLPTSIYTINPEEKDKSLRVVTRLLEKIIRNKPRRSCVIVSFGGGLTGNLAGMVAGLLFRGVPLVHIPTTLLAMSDSILSQKQAVNGPISKNSFGLFHKAQLNIIELNYLSTLPNEQMYGGILELVKNCLAFDPDTIDQLKSYLVLPFTLEAKNFFVEIGIKQKQVLLDEDPFEKNRGIILEYGHTIGHALEINQKNLHHGQAVGLGMLVSAYVSYQREWLTIEDVKLHAELMALCKCPLKIEDNTRLEDVMESVRSDNKKGKIVHEEHETPMVLLDKIGHVKPLTNSYLLPASFTEISKALQVLKSDFFEQLLK